MTLFFFFKVPNMSRLSTIIEIGIQNESDDWGFCADRKSIDIEPTEFHAIAPCHGWDCAKCPLDTYSDLKRLLNHLEKVYE